MKLFVTIVSLLIMFSWCTNLNAQLVAQHQMIRVQLQVEAYKGTDNQIDNESCETITSYFGRELRGLNDVVIVDKDPDWLISITMMDIISRANQPMAKEMSFVIMQQSLIVPALEMFEFTETSLTKEQRDQIKQLIKLSKDSMNIVYNTPLSFNESDIPIVAQKMVTLFDKRYLKESRKDTRDAVDNIPFELPPADK